MIFWFAARSRSLRVGGVLFAATAAAELKAWAFCGSADIDEAASCWGGLPPWRSGVWVDFGRRNYGVLKYHVAKAGEVVIITGSFIKFLNV